MPRPPWTYEEPLCKEIESEFFFLMDKDEPVSDAEPRNTDYVEAKKICSGCIHRPDCAEWGILHEGHGVWGGLSPHERVMARRRRNIIMDTQPIFIR